VLPIAFDGCEGYKRPWATPYPLCWALVGRMRLASCLGTALFYCLLEMGAAYSSWGFLRGETELWGDQALGQPHVFSQPSPWGWVDVSQLQAASPLHPVSVWCQEAQVVVTVHRDRFGTGRLVRAADLTLGTAACPATAQNAAENVVTFVAGLHECGSTLQVRWDARMRGCSTFGDAAA